MGKIDRRQLIESGGGFALLLCAPNLALAQSAVKSVKELKPGQYTWHPERSPSGPVAIIVSIPDQRVHVYRNGIRIGVSTCSTGAKGHATPTGVFMILEKDKNHRSSTYNNAPMPNMNRLTWSGIALHAGNLPGYPASHGCIRLPAKFSELLFGITKVGTPVILAGSHADPKEITHPGLVLGQYAATEFASVKTSLKKEVLPWQPKVSPREGSTAIIVSRGDMSITLLENGAPVASGKAIISKPDEPLGRHVLILTGASDQKRGLSWHAIGHHDDANVQIKQPDEAVIQRIRAEQAMLNAIQDRMHPGMLFITTDLPAHPDTMTGSDFVLMNTDG